MRVVVCECNLSTFRTDESFFAHPLHANLVGLVTHSSSGSLHSLLARRLTASEDLLVTFLHLLRGFHAWFEQEDGGGGGERHHHRGTNQDARRRFHLSCALGCGQQPSHVVRGLGTHVPDGKTRRLRTWRARGRPSQLRHRHGTRRHGLVHVKLIPQRWFRHVFDRSVPTRNLLLKPKEFPFETERRTGFPNHRPCRMGTVSFPQGCDERTKVSISAGIGGEHTSDPKEKDKDAPGDVPCAHGVVMASETQRNMHIHGSAVLKMSKEHKASSGGTKIRIRLQRHAAKFSNWIPTYGSGPQLWPPHPITSRCLQWHTRCSDRLLPSGS